MPINVSCVVCGNLFLVTAYREKTAKVCSKECNIIHRRRKMSGEGNHQYGLKKEKNSSWKGGKRISNYGYVLVYVSDVKRNRKSDDYAFEHRLVMEDYLGRKLKKTELVHHINGIKTDNRISNLEILSRSEHTSLHNKENEIIRNDLGQFKQIRKKHNDNIK